MGRVEGILECLFFCLLSGGKSRFRDSCCSTLASKTLPLTTKNFGRRPPKPDRGCKFRASIEHKLTSGLSQKTVCVYAICSGLSGMSSQFCYNVTKCSWMQEDKSANVRCHVWSLNTLCFTSCHRYTNSFLSSVCLDVQNYLSKHTWSSLQTAVHALGSGIWLVNSSLCMDPLLWISTYLLTVCILCTQRGSCWTIQQQAINRIKYFN